MSGTKRNVILVILGLVLAAVAVILGLKWFRKNRQVKGGDSRA
jgi:LPXTG-motif cell wall-anchored protein